MKAILPAVTCLLAFAITSIATDTLASGPTLSVNPTTIVVGGTPGSVTGSGYVANESGEIYFFFYADSCHDPNGGCSYVSYAGPVGSDSSGDITASFTTCPTNNTYYWLFAFDYGQGAWSNNATGVKVYCEYIP